MTALRTIVAVMTLLTACASSQHPPKTDLERLHDFWKSLVPTTARDTTKVGCICQGGMLRGRIGTLYFAAYTGIGGMASCYTLDFDLQGKLLGGTPCDDTFVIVRE